MLRNILFIGLLFILTTTLYGFEDLFYKRVLDLEGNWKFSIGDNLKWAEPNYNDQYWEEIYVPSAWEDEGFSGFDGYAWYRKTLPGEQLRNKENLYLMLGYIDDVDEVFFNGVRIGFSGSFPPKAVTAYNAKRIYHIPADIINYEGPNTISVRVFDFTLGGGIVSGDVGIYTLFYNAADLLVLDGLWKFREGDASEFIKPSYDDSNWNDFIIPGLWKIKDHYVHDDGSGVAWFRRKFELTPALAEAGDLALYLGKIDDFDEVFINGYFIGETNDDKRIGRSKSWLVKRVYTIPEKYLNKKGPNTISVRVYDLGGDSGIYSGPVAIMKQEDVTRFVRYHD
jgi:sialate O-acetylesterase